MTQAITRSTLKQQNKNNASTPIQCYASDFMIQLHYVDWSHFQSIIERAREIGAQGGIEVEEHFRPVFRTSPDGAWEDYQLSALACYLVAVNGDTGNEATAKAQLYFMQKYFSTANTLIK